jgi:4-amino-4-deoxy-L-arabinose transferase-like glycosyltransferase
MNRPWQNWLMLAAFILWIFFVLASFFAVQKPFSAANILALGHMLLDLLVAGWLVLVGLGLGTWLLRLIFGSDLTLIERLVLGTGLGWGILGLFWFGLGLLGRFQPAVAYGVTLALTIVVAPQLWRFFRRWRQWRPVNLPKRWTVFYLAVMGLLALLVALLPPTDWDGLFYHLTGPKLYLHAGRIVGGLDVPHFNFPSLMEMLFAWGMLLRNDITAKLLHTSFGLLLAGLVYISTRRLLGQRAAWPAVIILVSMPMLATLAGWAYNDLALAFYQFGSLYAIIRWVLVGPDPSWVGARPAASDPPPEVSVTDEPAPAPDPESARFAKLYPYRWLLLSAVFSGLAMGLKYTSFVTPLLIVLLILWFGRRPGQAARSVKNVVIFAAVAGLVALPWYAKNWAYTGNPVYPFLSGLFGGQYWDSFRAAWYASAGSGVGLQPTTLLALPWLLTLGVRDANFWDGRTGPLLLLFLPLIIWTSLSRRHKVRPAAFNLLLIYVLAHFVVWTLGIVWSRSLWQSRLLLPGLVGLVPLAGWVWVNLSSFDLPRFSLSRFVNVAVGIALALILIDALLLTLRINPVPYLVGLETRDQHLGRRLGAHYAAMQQINETLPPDSKVVFLWEPRSYYCQPDCRPDSILDEFPHLVYQHGSAANIAQVWRDEGVSHVLVHRNGLDFMLVEQPAAVNVEILHALEQHHLQEDISVGQAYKIFTVR